MDDGGSPAEDGGLKARAAEEGAVAPTARAGDVVRLHLPGRSGSTDVDTSPAVVKWKWSKRSGQIFSRRSGEGGSTLYRSRVRSRVRARVTCGGQRGMVKVDGAKRAPRGPWLERIAGQKCEDQRCNGRRRCTLLTVCV